MIMSQGHVIQVTLCAIFHSPKKSHESVDWLITLAGPLGR